MSGTAGTGNGSTLTLGTQGGSHRFLEIAGHEESVAVLDDNDLSTTGFMETCPSDLDELGEFDVPIRFRASEGLPALKVVETITITFKQKAGETAPASIAGTGFITKRTWPVHKNGELQEGKITIKWDGKTGPAFTAATTS